MRISIVIPEPGHSGGIQMIFQYAQYMTESGHDVTFYYPSTGYYTGWKKIFFLKSLYRYRKEYKNPGEWFPEKSFKIVKPFCICNSSIADGDIVIATAWQTAYMVAGLNAKKGKKVYFIQGYELWGKGNDARRASESYKLPFDKYITVSSLLKDTLVEKYGKDYTVICNGIPLSELGNIQKKKLQDKNITIAFPYREDRIIKNCDTAIGILERIEKENRNVLVTAYGFKKPSNFPAHWLFLENPSRKELYEFYERADIFYVPSLYEGWGLPAMEAMGHGVAVVAHRSGIVAEIGVNEENCVFLNDPMNQNETIQKLDMLIKDREKRNIIGEKAFEVISEKFILEKQGQKFLNELMSLTKS